MQDAAGNAAIAAAGGVAGGHVLAGPQYPLPHHGRRLGPIPIAVLAKGGGEGVAAGAAHHHLQVDAIQQGA